MKKIGLISALALGWILSEQAFAAGAFPGYPVAIPPLTGNETIPADTNLGQGLNPATELLSPGAITNFASPVFVLTDAATITTNANLSNLFRVVLGGNRVLANPTNLVSGKVFRYMIVQDATGSRTLTYGNLFTWPVATAPTLTTTANATDMITCVYDGVAVKLRCSAQLAFG
jgi:hypothetical protein